MESQEIKIKQLETETKRLERKARIFGFLHVLNGSLSICTFLGYPVPMLLISGFSRLFIGLALLLSK